MDDRLRRTRVVVAPYASGDAAARKILSLYHTADLVMGMRFHANVCSLALGRNVLGLNCYMQIENLFRGLRLSDQLVDVAHVGFAKEAVLLADTALTNNDRFSAASRRAVARVNQARTDFEPHLQNWQAKIGF